MRRSIALPLSLQYEIISSNTESLVCGEPVRSYASLSRRWNLVHSAGVLFWNLPLLAFNSANTRAASVRMPFSADSYICFSSLLCFAHDDRSMKDRNKYISRRMYVLF